VLESSRRVPDRLAIFQTVIKWAHRVTLMARGRECSGNAGAASFAANRYRFDREIGE